MTSREILRASLFTGYLEATRNICLFAEHASGLTLRRYQQAVARAVVHSVIHTEGLSFVVMFPRQSGKNELQAQIEAYLLTLLSTTDAEIIKVSPTWKPQSLNAMRRLQRILERNLITQTLWKKEQGYIYRIEKARIFFLSGSPEANIVGATASTLLEVDEAQDVLIAKYDKDLAPMAASTNATRIFWGTAWTSNTLLARELRAAREAQDRDGKRRVFVLAAPDVAAEVPAYGRFVEEQVAKLGRNNPMVKSQFFSEEIDAEAGMFPPNRQALMQGDHPQQICPTPGKIYALLIDVAGEDEGLSGSEDKGTLSNPGRDSTAATVIEVDTSTIADPLIKRPTYRVVTRFAWTGTKHTRLYSQLRALAETWRARYLVVDATGVGAGLASFLDAAFPGRVIPFTFNTATKSKLGWDFLAIIETGRYREYSPFDKALSAQLTSCQMEIIPGPERRMKWSVPDGTRDPATGELLHDDLVLSAALVAVLDEQEWFAPSSGPVIVQVADPLSQMDREGY